MGVTGSREFFYRLLNSPVGTRQLEGRVCASLPNSSIRARCSESTALSKAAQERAWCSETLSDARITETHLRDFSDRNGSRPQDFRDYSLWP